VGGTWLLEEEAIVSRTSVVVFLRRKNESERYAVL